MKKCFKGFVQLAVALTFISSAYADKAAVTKAMAKSMPSMKVDSIKPAVVKGLFEVVAGTAIYYVSEDGNYLLQGRLIDIAAHKDLTEDKLNGARKLAIEKIGQANMIVFKPKIAKYTVTIFTDIDCGYCRKLHSEMDQYLAQGITIQYLFFPRAGKGSDSYNKAVSVWCAEDRNAALTAAKKDQKLPEKTCDNPVDKHMQLAAEFDLKGTPMIISEKGIAYPGYLPAKQLVEALENESKTQ